MCKSAAFKLPGHIRANQRAFLYPFRLLTPTGSLPSELADGHKCRRGSIPLPILAWDIQSPCTPVRPPGTDMQVVSGASLLVLFCPPFFFLADALKIVQLLPLFLNSHQRPAHFACSMCPLLHRRHHCLTPSGRGHNSEQTGHCPHHLTSPHMRAHSVRPTFFFVADFFLRGCTVGTGRPGMP